jgi:hypothetical protein
MLAPRSANSIAAIGAGPDTRELDYAKTGERSHRRFGFSDSVQHVSAISAVHLIVDFKRARPHALSVFLGVFPFYQVL